MQKQSIFQSKLLPYALVAPQLAIVLIFFYWPAAQAVIQSFLLQDAFGLSTTFVWFENYLELFKEPAYFAAIVRTFAFSFAIAVSSLSFALLLAVMADKPLRGSTLYRTLLIWPYAVAPPVVGVLWVFMLHPSLGVLSRYLRAMGVDWNPLLNGDQAAALIILAAAWKQISYNFLFFLTGLQSIPKSVIEAAAIEATMPSPPITASQSQGVASLSRPSTKTCFGISGNACTARASAHSEARRILSRSIRAGEATATENAAVAQISSNSSSRRSAVSRLESSRPLGTRLGSSTTAAATTGPASGPRPASSQPATGQMPRLISARSRRKLGRVTAITRLPGLADLAGAFFDVLFDALLDLSRIMRGMVVKPAPRRNWEPGALPRYSIG